MHELGVILLPGDHIAQDSNFRGNVIALPLFLKFSDKAPRERP